MTFLCLSSLNKVKEVPHTTHTFTTHDRLPAAGLNDHLRLSLRLGHLGYLGHLGRLHQSLDLIQLGYHHGRLSEFCQRLLLVICNLVVFLQHPQTNKQINKTFDGLVRNRSRFKKYHGQRYLLPSPCHPCLSIQRPICALAHRRRRLGWRFWWPRAAH